VGMSLTRSRSGRVSWHDRQRRRASEPVEGDRREEKPTDDIPSLGEHEIRSEWGGEKRPAIEGNTTLDLLEVRCFLPSRSTWQPHAQEAKRRAKLF